MFNEPMRLANKPKKILQDLHSAQNIFRISSFGSSLIASTLFIYAPSKRRYYIGTLYTSVLMYRIVCASQNIIDNEYSKLCKHGPRSSLLNDRSCASEHGKILFGKEKY